MTSMATQSLINMAVVCAVSGTYRFGTHSEAGGELGKKTAPYRGRTCGRALFGHAL
jgi:hypothetical protein